MCSSQGTPHKLAVIFVDNSGVDIILGMFPFVRELLSHGTKVEKYFYRFSMKDGQFCFQDWRGWARYCSGNVNLKLFIPNTHTQEKRKQVDSIGFQL